MVGAQRGLLIMLAAGAIALSPSSLKVSIPAGDSPVEKTGPTANATYQVTDKEFYLAADQVSYVRPGLKVTLNSVTNVAPGQKPVVDLNITDDFGNPLDLYGATTPGVISLRFIVATWDATAYSYTNLIIQSSTGNPYRDTSPAGDPNHQWNTLDVGHYTYTFATKLPSFDTSLPATLFCGGNRNVVDYIGKTYYVNQFKDFAPTDPTATPKTWGATTLAACNQCHDPLVGHGQNYRDPKTCALCHNPNNFPEAEANGDNYNGRAWFMQIHSGNSVAVADITFPQLVQRCVTCHDPKAANGDTWKTMPSRVACGSCHPDVNFVTGENHGPNNLPQADDTQCGNAGCHPSTQTAEWDGSVPGSHVLPSDSTQLKGLTATIVNVTNAAPGQAPTVSFKMTNKDGSFIAPNAPDFTTLRGSLNLLFGGDTADYYFIPGAVRENATKASYDPVTGIATFTFKNKIPADAKGTWTVTLEARRDVNLVKADGSTKEMYEEGAPNPTFNVSVDGSAVKARRTVVALAKCNSCHYRLGNTFSHGGQRLVIEECVICHNAEADDSSRRPADGSANPAESISFQRMIHRIHTGEELTQDYTVYGFGGSANTFNEVTYPGDRRNCLACHTNTAAYNLPTAPGTIPVVTMRDYFSPRGPGTAACTGCHDDSNVAAHAFIYTAYFPNSPTTPAESCGTCHSANGDWSATQVHAR